MGNFSRTLVRELQSRYPKHEYHLFSANVGKLSSELEYFLEDHRFHIHTSGGQWAPLWRSYGCTNLFDALELDIFHGLSHELPLNIRKSRVKSVLSFHDLIYERYPQQFGLWDRYMYQWKYARSARLADQVVAISNSTRRDLLDIYQLPEQKIDVIYQGQSVSLDKKPVVKNRFDLPEEYWLYVGSVIPRKRLEDIIQALANISAKKRIPLVIVGTGTRYKAKVDKLIEEHKLEDQIIWFGQIPNDVLHQIYCGAIGLIYPSIYEGFGLPLIEAIASGTPVIAADASSLPEAGGTGALFFEAQNVDDLVDTMQKLYNDASLRNQLVQSGQSYIKSHFDHSQICERWISLYYDMID